MGIHLALFYLIPRLVLTHLSTFVYMHTSVPILVNPSPMYACIVIPLIISSTRLTLNYAYQTMPTCIDCLICLLFGYLVHFYINC